MRKILLLSFAIFLSSFALQAQQQPPPVTIAIRAGKLIDVDHSRLLTNQIILIRENGTIAAVGAYRPDSGPGRIGSRRSPSPW